MRCCVRLYACLLFFAVDAKRFESDCGTAVAKGNPTIVNGGAAKYGTFPWNVGVYSYTGNGTYGHICGGTLISSELVISAAHCFHDETRGQLRDAKKFKIAAGKFYRDYDSPDDPYVQKSSVRSIDIPDRYTGYSGNYGEDIALVWVESPFSTTELVKPVCVHWDILDGIEHPLSEQIGKVVGWGRTETKELSNDLKEIDLPFVPYDNCSAAVPPEFRNFLTPKDKFCAGFLNGSSVCDGDSGAGLCFEHGGLWYLRGIVSAIPRGTIDLPCDNNQYAAFTNVDSFLEWIYSAFVGARIVTNGCTLPNQPKSGSFKLTCRDKCDGVPGSVVPRGSVLVHRCEKDHILKGNGVATCGISGWNSLPTCIKACTPLASSNQDIVCEFGGQIVSCGSLMAPGTKGSLACPTFYKISGTYNSTYDQITCLDEGEWDRPTPQCVPECGIVPDSEDLFRDTVNGTHQHAGLPWEVQIHYIGPDNPGVGYTMQGTLIQPDLVLTAYTHQVFLNVNEKRRDLGDFIASAGHVRNLNTTEEFWQQKSKIEAFNYIEPMGEDGRLPDNSHATTGLVFLRLATPFVMTTWVRPVCIDWDNRFVADQLRKGNVGKVPKTSFETNETSVDGESGIDFTYISREDCMSLFTEAYKYLFTEVVYCGHTLTEAIDADTCDGLSISFESEGLWYLRGVVGGLLYKTVLLRPSNGTYAGFINVGNFLEWIRAAYDDGSGCTLPEQHKDGKFELVSCQETCVTEPGSRVPEGSVLVHRCNEGWRLNGRDTSTCGNKEWDTLPKCIKQCQTLESPSVSMICKYDGKRSSCGSHVAPGTTAFLACKDFYKVSGPRNSTNYEMICLDGGEWDGPTFQCVPECGTLVDSKDQFRETAKGKYQHAELPWMVIITMVSPIKKYNLWKSAGGTLIKPDLVLSAFDENFFLDDIGRPRGIKDYVVRAGRLYDSTVTEKYFYLQGLDIESINYMKITELQRFDRRVTGLVLLRLKLHFTMSTYVRTVCMDWDNRLVAEQLREGNVGKVPKVNYATDASVDGSSSIDYTYLPREDCQRLLTEEKRNSVTTEEFCAHTWNRTTRPGISFESEGLWYLRGIRSGWFSSSDYLNVSDRFYFTFINVGDHLQWIRAAYDDERIDTGGPSGCILPEKYKNGKFELVPCPGECKIRPGSRVPTGSVLLHQCDNGWMLEGKKTSTCGNKEWDSLPYCIKQCRSLVSPSVDMVCTYKGKRLPCDSHMAPGTTASLSCKKSYTFSKPWNSTNYEITCLDGGEWDRPRLPCVRECGTIVDSKNQFHDTPRGKRQYAELPWAVGISLYGYRKNGTLIQSDLVLSVLDEKFFWDDNGQRHDIKNIAVYAGRLYDVNTAKYSHLHVSNVTSFNHIYVPELHRTNRDVTGFVLLRLATPFRLTLQVRPVCIDWDNRLLAEQLREGNVGKVPKTFFATELSVNGASSIDYTFLPGEDCLRLLKDEFQYSVTTAEFCAHTLINTTNVRLSDGVYFGLGISFESGGVWYLRGVLSGYYTTEAILSATNRTYATFINVGNFSEWIRETYGNGSGCVLPEQHKDGKFELVSCQGACNTEPGSRVPTGSVIVHRCNQGWKLEGSETSTCGNKEWDSLPKCINDRKFSDYLTFV